jgi:hypothetical protein
VVMILIATVCFDVSSLCPVVIPKPHPQLQCNEEIWVVLTSLHEVLAWCESPMLLLARESVWHGFFFFFFFFFFFRKYSWRTDKSSPYWCLIHPPSFWEPFNDLVLLFHGHLRFYLHFERSKNDHFLDHRDDPTAVFNSFEPFINHSKPVYERDSIVTISLFYQLESFSSSIASLFFIYLFIANLQSTP